MTTVAYIGTLSLRGVFEVYEVLQGCVSLVVDHESLSGSPQDKSCFEARVVVLAANLCFRVSFGEQQTAALMASLILLSLC
jgi:hypothetical protein